MKFKLIKHNTDDQVKWAGHNDTRKHLKIGEIYEGKKKAYTWHTRIIINGKDFNSLCFKQILNNCCENQFEL